MALNASVGFQIPTNVVEVGDEISSDQLAALNAASTPSAGNPLATTTDVATAVTGMLTISTLSNGATTNLYGMGPATGFVLSYNGTELEWVTPAGATGAAGANGTNGTNGTMNYLDIATITATNIGSYFSSVSFVYYAFISTGWLPNKIGANVYFNVYVNGTFDNQTTGSYSSGSAQIYFVTTPNTNDVITFFLADLAGGEATIPFVTATY